MSAVSGPLKKRPRLSEPDDAGAQETALLPSEEGSAFVVDDDDDLGDLAMTFDLAPRAHMLDESAKWAKKAKESSLALLRGEMNQVIWWRRYDAGPFALSHLSYSARTGVYEFNIPASACMPLHDYLADPLNRDANGFIVMDGDSWPGYGAYDLVHSEMGCVPRLQEVRAHAHTDAHTHTLATPAPMPMPLPITAPEQLKTVRVKFKTQVDRWLSKVPALADLVKEVCGPLPHLQSSPPTSPPTHTPSPSPSP
jgi:hypothetical protein